MEYSTNSHCKYLIAVHLIFVVKYRKPLLNGQVAEFTKQTILDLQDVSEFKVIEIEVDNDHLHMLLSITPNISISQHVRLIKQKTNYALWNRFKWLKQHFWNEKTFWSDGYFVCSVGNASAETVKRYIQEQG